MDILVNEHLLYIIVLTFLLIASIVYLVRIMLAYKRLRSDYKDIIDIDEEVRKRKRENQRLMIESDRLESEFQEKSRELNSDYEAKRSIYTDLRKELGVLEEDLELTTFGIYKPHYDYDSSEVYKTVLDDARRLQKQTIKDKGAIICHVEWTVEGSKRKGKKMSNQYMKLMLRAFNHACDAAVMKVRWNSVLKMEERIQRAFNEINKLGMTQHIEITGKYLALKMEEVRLTHEHQEKLHEEKEEQRRIREQMREDEKVQREIEKEKREAEKEEKDYQAALDRARREMQAARGEELGKLNEEVARLQGQLEEVQVKKERAISRAQQTKSGHVYVLSNEGSFGKNVYKIGMTRRLVAQDRVRELGDASVPFYFDVHAMIFSENAPKLESELHCEFDRHRVNLVNTRKEFFAVSLDEIEMKVKQRHAEIEFTKLAEAREFRETLALRERGEVTLEKEIEGRFPTEL